MNPQSNFELLQAFPTSVREEALIAISVLPENPHSIGVFSVLVNGESLSIPCRVYHNVTKIDTIRLSDSQQHLLDCILTRHCDGRVREKHLTRILALNRKWIPPFVVQLLGEYVIEIIEAIEKSLPNLDAALYTQFLKSNPAFLSITEQRVMSYWNCYHRAIQKDKYVGFRVLRFFKGLVEAKA